MSAPFATGTRVPIRLVQKRVQNEYARVYASRQSCRILEVPPAKLVSLSNDRRQKTHAPKSKNRCP